MSEDYQDYEIMDFVMDEAFFRWVIRPNEKLDNFWREWLERHPHKQKEIEEARLSILHIRELLKSSNR